MSQDGVMDAAYLNQVLSSLPGVDPSDPAIAAALEEQRRQEEGKKDDK